MWVHLVQICSDYYVDMEETSNKIIALVTTVFDPSDRERHDILIRVVQCVKFILEESHCDFSLATSALISRKTLLPCYNFNLVSLEA